MKSGLGIRVKLLLPILAMAGVCLAAVHFVWLPAELQEEQRKIRKIELDAVNMLHLSVMHSLTHGEADQVDQILEHALEDRPDWRALRYLDNHGQILFPKQPGALPSGPNILEVQRTVDYHGAVIGTLYSYVDISRSVAEQRARARSLEFSFALLVLLASVASLLIQNRLIRQPLLDLEGAARRMADGEFSVRLPEAAQDEVGSLTRSFDRMRANLQLAQTRLEEKAEQAEQARQLAEAANRAKSAFLTNMSHEIRTPMNGVLGMLTLLKESSLAREQRTHVDTAVRSGEALLALLNDILDLSKIEAGHLKLEGLDFDLRLLIEDVVGLHAAKATKQGLSIACLIAADVPDRVHGDPTRIRQVLNNLVSNAVKFTSEGEVLVQVSLEHAGGALLFDDEPVEDAAAEDDLTVHFSVSDTGIGIPQDKLDAIFGDFIQVDDSITRKYGGTGLGLSICRHLVQAMGGEIHAVANGDAAGSTFRFFARLQRATQPFGSSRPHSDLDGKRVLICNTNGTVRMVLQNHLSSWNVKHDSAETAELALRMLDEAVQAGRPFDCVLLEHSLSGIDGLSLARQIHARSEPRATRLVMLSANAQRGEMAEARVAGVQGYLTVPVRTRELHDTLTTVLGLRLDVQAPVVTRHVLAEYQQQQAARILLVEDNQVNKTIVVTLLTREGHRVDVAENGQEALEALAQRAYDLVLMDMQMPVMDGLEATRRIREREPDSQHLPIIAMTANAMSEDQARCLEAGMDDYLVKPFNPDEFRQMLSRRLVRTRRGN